MGRLSVSVSLSLQILATLDLLREHPELFSDDLPFPPSHAAPADAKPTTADTPTDTTSPAGGLAVDTAKDAVAFLGAVAEEARRYNQLRPIVFVSPELGKWTSVGGLGIMVGRQRTHWCWRPSLPRFVQLVRVARANRCQPWQAQTSGQTAARECALAGARRRLREKTPRTQIAHRDGVQRQCTCAHLRGLACRVARAARRSTS